MEFVNFLQYESNRSLRQLLAIGILAGIASTLVLGIISYSSKFLYSGELSDRFFFIYIVLIILFIVTQRYVQHRGTSIVEKTLQSVRKRLSAKIIEADLMKLEQMGQAEIFNRLTQETSFISQSATLIVNGLQLAVLIVFLFIYISFISTAALVAVSIMLVAGTLIYLRNVKSITEMLQNANSVEIRFFEAVADVIHGIKEVKLHLERKKALKKYISSLSTTLHTVRVAVEDLYTKNYIFAQVFFFGLFGVVVFILPKIINADTETVILMISAVFFLTGPVSSVVSVLPIIKKAEMSIGYIRELENALDAAADRTTGLKEASNEFYDFSNIQFDAVEFQYNSKNGNSFGIGPINFDINRGDLIFLTGGNGSGKTTLLKVLTLLYYPQKGSVRIDGNTVSNDKVLSYRKLFSVIFSDFHLFHKLYGSDSIDKKFVDEWLSKMELSNKTAFLDDHFSTTDLSTGQKKRLALIIAMLEDKPFFLFDEWAADQDPEFKDYFYFTLLPKLKQAGKTVFAITHDDRYYHLADRVIKMEYGSIVFNGKTNQ
jgi:putative ATP-binding cassette transporter